MSLLQKILEDRLEARKKQDKETINLLSTVIGELNRRTSYDESDSVVESIIHKMIKANTETMDNCDFDDYDRMHKLTCENSLLMKYLPEKLEGDELIDFVTSFEFIVCMQAVT